MLRCVHVLVYRVILCTGADSTLRTCGGQLSGLYGDFQSPGFPDKYDTSITCDWTITVPVGHHVRLEFTEFQLEEHGKDCDYDRVTVLEGSNVSC